MFNQRTKNGSFDTWIPPAKEGIQFRLIDSVESPESGVQSPPLWKNNSSTPSSPISRIQAIIKGQKELMDMVKNMPESNYELTLKDLVQKQQNNLGDSHEEEEEEEEEEEDQLIFLHELNSTKKKEEKKIGMNNDNGLLIKMVFFPTIGMKSSKKKKSNLLKSSSSLSSAKISPKPDVLFDNNNNNNNNKTAKNGGNGWLRNMFSGGSDCSRSNSNERSSKSIRTKRGFYLFNCISCFKLQNDSKAPCFSG